MFITYLILGLIIGAVTSWSLARAGRSADSQTLQTTQKQLGTAKEELAQAHQQALQRAQDLARLETANEHLTEKLAEQNRL